MLSTRRMPILVVLSTFIAFLAIGCGERGNTESNVDVGLKNSESNDTGQLDIGVDDAGQSDTGGTDTENPVDTSQDAAFTDVPGGDVEEQDSGTTDALADIGGGDLAEIDGNMEEAENDGEVSDTGGPADTGEPVHIQLQGSVQKGPLLLGSSVQVAMLDPQANPTGKIFSTTTINDLGEFKLVVNEAGYVELIGSGFYYNEITGGLSTAPITIHAFANIQQSGTQQAYLNVVTHMAQLRVKKLILDGETFKAAIVQAENELRMALGILHPDSNNAGAGTSMNLLGGDSADNEYLFGVICILAHATEGNDAKLQELINTIASELEIAGQITQTTFDKLTIAQQTVDPCACMLNLSNWLAEKNSSAVVPDMRKVADPSKWLDCTARCGGPTNCGTMCPDNCMAPQTCGGGGTQYVCGCTPEEGATFCVRLGANCDNVTANDNCGTQKTYNCGTCTSPQTCNGGGVQNVCGCTNEDGPTFCTRLGKNCDNVTANDNCGEQRTYNCGICASPDTCGGGGKQYVCGCTPNCAGNCNGPDSCGGMCPNSCTLPDVCFNNICCTPTCIGKCGGASDECMGICESCPTNFVCQDQSCKACGNFNQPCCAVDLCSLGYVCTSGICKKINGQLCSTKTDCASGNCPSQDLVCCNEACDGLCETCLAVKRGLGTDGICGAVKTGTDPDNECTTGPKSTCQKDGWCSGIRGACELWENGTVCNARSCTADLSGVNLVNTCDGLGTCMDSGTQNCTPGVTVCGGAPSDYTCIHCGDYAEPCCTGDACNGLNTCNNGRCVSNTCVGKGNFTLCKLVTIPDRKYDICVDEVCVSPGCDNNGSCSEPGPHFPLPDTDQRKCYDNSAEMTCPAFPCLADGTPDFCGQDAQYGWDTTHQQAIRYTKTKLVTGEPLVADNITGLNWQGCPAGLSGSGCTIGTILAEIWPNAPSYCEGLTWAGYSDWRLPDSYELQSIADYGFPIDTTAFPATPSYYFWSSSSYVSNSAWVVVNMGYVSIIDKSNHVYIRCVRGIPSPQPTRFSKAESVIGEPLMTDNTTGLTWQGCTAGQSGTICEIGTAPTYTWQNALKYCEGLSWGNQTDWRLPNVNELSSIVDRRHNTINTVVFPATPNDYFWSSSTYGGEQAWIVNFSDSYVDRRNKTSPPYYVRCVRE